MPTEELTIKLTRPHKDQRTILRQADRFNVLNCGRRYGKTVLGLHLVCQTAINGGQAGWFVPEYKYLTESWREIKTSLKPIIRRTNDTEKRIELRTGGVIEGWSFDRNPDAGRSRKYRRVVIDEAAHTDALESAWPRAIRPTLTDYEGDAWFLSSPNGKNYFHTLFRRGHERKAPGWRSWVRTSYQNPLLNPMEIDAARIDQPDLIFRQEYLAEFLDDVAAQLIPESWIDRCTMVQRAGNGLKAMSVDLSKGTGRDRTVAIVADEYGVVDIVADSRIDVLSASLLVLQLSKQWGVRHDRIVYDAGGWSGSDLEKYLEPLNIREAVPYYGSATGGGRYKNRRSQAAWALRRRLDPDRPRMLAPPLPRPAIYYPEIARHVPDRPPPPIAERQPAFHIPTGPHWLDLRDELMGLRYVVDGHRVAMEEKGELVHRLGHSPDLADAMIMLASLWGDD